MVRSVATIAKRDQVCRFIGSTSGPRNQVMNVGLAPRTDIAARPANMAVASKYNLSDFTPSLVILALKIVGRWFLQVRFPRRVGPTGATCDATLVACP